MVSSMISGLPVIALVVFLNNIMQSKQRHTDAAIFASKTTSEDKVRYESA